jgi:hypothetical protein
MKDSREINTPRDSNFFKGIADHLKLVWRLWQDPRITPFLKILPLGSILYLISPFDMAIPLIDDIGILWFFTYLFVELCPDEIVEEHRHAIQTTIQTEWKKEEDDDYQFQEEDIEDAHFEEKLE